MKLKNYLKVLLLGVVAFSIGFFIKTYFLKPSGEIEFKTDIHDFEEIPYNSQAEFYFKYVNNGRSKVTIDDIKTSCGCTVADWSKYPLPKNSIDSVLISYDTKIEGYFSREIAISSNAINSPHRIWITGTVLPPIEE
ncbi:DUF1573 domain-containing protein [Roseivirga echinicomitans]